MRANFLILALGICMVAFSGCKKSDDRTTNPNTCLSPATSYIKMDDSAADVGTTSVVFQANNGYCEFRYSTFSGLINANLLELSQVRLSFSFMKGTTFSTTDINLIDSIAEGGCMKLPLRLFSGIRSDSVCAFLNLDTREKRPTSVGTSTDNYVGTVAGNIFISKVAGKLRFTSDGTLSATDRVSGNHLHTLNFSGLSQETF